MWAKADCTHGLFSITRFPNKELQLTLSTPVKGHDCYILGSLSPSEKNLFMFLVLTHTLKKERAGKITAYIPYLAYSRQERKESQKSQIAALIGKLLHASGVDEIVTIDVHSRLIEGLFTLPIRSLSPAFLFAETLTKHLHSPYTLVAPDQGAIERCTDVARLLHHSAEIVHLTKTRHSKGVCHSNLCSKVQQQVVIIDDILDTGATLISCCQKVLEHGAKKILVMVTHGLFTGTKWKKLWKLGVTHIYCTDTVPLSKAVQKEKRISVLPIGEHIWND